MLKIMKIYGQSATKPRIEEGSTTIPKGSTTQAIGVGSGVCYLKIVKI